MKQPEDRHWVKDYLFPIGSLLVGVLGLLAQTTLPHWVILTATAYLIVVAAVVLYPTAIRIGSWVRSRARISRLAKSKYPELLRGVRTLVQLTTSQNANTMLDVFKTAAHWDEKSGKGLMPDSQYIETVRNWLLAIERRAATRRPTEFLNLCEEFSNVTHQYNHFLCDRLQRLQQLIREGDLVESRRLHLKQQWNVNREFHVGMISNWQSAAREINETARTRVCVDYYQPLGTLE